MDKSMDKSMNDRLRECVSIITKLSESLGIPTDSLEVTELRAKMNEYIRNGETWEGKVDFSTYGRIAVCSFPKKANATVEVTLKKIIK